jgi:hypothetical protein
MAEPAPPNAGTPTGADAATAAGAPRSKDEVALELMKFIAVTTGYGKSSGSSAGFSGKPVTRSAEEHADALLELFERCRRVVNKGESAPAS